MSVVYTENLIVGQVAQSDLNNPLIGWHNVVPTSTLEASSEQDGFPVSNLSSPVTYQRWRGVLDGYIQYVTITLNTLDAVDYLAIAGHNFSSGGFALWVEGSTDGDEWEAITPEAILPDDGPALFRFEQGFFVGLRLAIQGGSLDPFLAVMYAGALLILPRRIYVGHSPMPLNRKTEVLTGRGETGQFLGRVTRRQFTQSSINMRNIDPAFYRSSMRPWVRSAETKPFFFAWRPYSYPLEVAFCWATDDGTVTNDKANGLMSFVLSLQGVTA